MNQDQHSTAQGSQVEAHVPLLSVTVLNYNYAHYLPQCLDSILRQTFTDFELLLINDCSTDNSLDVIQPYLADPRVTLINHEQNRGYIASLIEGSERSRGTYLTVISADDFCVSDRAFETLLRPMEDDDEVAYSFSAFGMYDEDGVRFHEVRHFAHSLVHSGAAQYRELLLQGNFLLHSGVLIRTSAYHAVGGYDDSIRYVGDSIMWQMLCSQGKAAYCVDELYAYRRHRSNMSISDGATNVSIRETIYGLNKSFAVMSNTPDISHDLYVRGMKRTLSSHAENAAFAGNLSGAWSAYLYAASLHPVWTVFQARTLIMLARVVLGAGGYQAMRDLLRAPRASLTHLVAQRPGHRAA